MSQLGCGGPSRGQCHCLGHTIDVLAPFSHRTRRFSVRFRPTSTPSRAGAEWRPGPSHAKPLRSRFCRRSLLELRRTPAPPGSWAGSGHVRSSGFLWPGRGEAAIRSAAYGISCSQEPRPESVPGCVAGPGPESNETAPEFCLKCSCCPICVKGSSL